MFNKSPLANRNEIMNRKDIGPTLAANASLAAGIDGGKNASNASSVNGDAVPKSTSAVGTETPKGAHLIVGPDVKLKGAEILDCDTLVVEGRVEATMDSRVIRIADKGAFSGKVSIDVAEIHGSFDGELTARSQLIIHATGRVSGKIRYGKLVIDEGGELCGDINALSAENRGFQRPASDLVPLLNAVSG